MATAKAKKRTKPAAKKKATARARSRAQATPPPQRETIVIRCGDIALNDDWNARDHQGATGTGRPIVGQWPDQPERQFTFEQLVESIRSEGLINPPTLRQVGDDYEVVAGTRRVKACVEIDPDWDIECTLQPGYRRKDEAEFHASVANLAENMMRTDLKPYEIADKLHRMKQARPDLTVAQMASAAAISKSYTYNLLRAREKTSEQMWQLFCQHGARYGAGITFKDFLDIVTKHPKGKQLEEWNKLVENRTSPNRSNSGNGDGAASPKSMSSKELEGCLAELHDPGETDWECGLRFALLVALGREQWAKRTSTGVLEGSHFGPKRPKRPKKKKTTRATASATPRKGRTK